MRWSGFWLATALAGWVTPGMGKSSPPAVEIELQHTDVTRVQRSVNPCENFFQYACGIVNAENPIPPDQTYWGVGSKLAAWNLQVLRKILENAESEDIARAQNEQKIGDFYASCMTQARLQRNDVKELDSLIARIRAIESPVEIGGVLGAIHNSFGRTWEFGDNQTNAAILGFGPSPDYNDVERVVAGVDQGGLGMPSRDFYINVDGDSKSIRHHYEQLIVRLLHEDGTKLETARLAAAGILRLETALASGQMDNIARRDPINVNNRFTLTELKALTPAFDWDGYFGAVGAPALPLYEVSAPAYFKVLNGQLVSERLDTWREYLRFHLLLSAAPYLGKPWRDAAFEFERALTGQPQQQQAWRRCTISVDRYLGEALGQAYVAQTFPAESKVRVQKMVKDIEAAMGRDIDTVTWMQAATKREAHQKLAAVIEKIGYPDKWIDYGELAITRTGYPSNAARATRFEFQRQLGLIGKPLDRAQWLMTPPTVDAYQDSQTNTINFPAGILQPPFFDPEQDDVINYGAEGAVIGHELTHDFDDQGRKFDTKGNLRDWWTVKDAQAYEQRGQCIAMEYTGAVPGVPGVRQNGALTLGEDTADNGGMFLALSALAEDLKQQGKSLDENDAHGLTNLQRFFIAYAQSWCEQTRPEAARTMVLTNPHSMPELRVNNVLGNMPAFHQAFSCKAGQAMVHAAACRVW